VAASPISDAGVMLVMPTKKYNVGITSITLKNSEVMLG
jgi:hypothetical protein